MTVLAHPDAGLSQFRWVFRHGYKVPPLLKGEGRGEGEGDLASLAGASESKVFIPLNALEQIQTAIRPMNGLFSSLPSGNEWPP